jgi:CheY-like chemotaxis protein
MAGGAQPEVAAGDFACISVSDTGSGMPRAVLERAFEPFFTTKAAGKGSGLGLSMVYGFARQSGGTAQLHSEPDAGTTVRLYLPLAEAAQEAHAVPAAEAAQPGRETVLVVEDEPGVRRVAALLLGATGYRVLEAQDAESALRLLDEQAGRVDLLFTDVVLPGMNGIELARRARGAYPGLAVLFASGYASGSVVGKLREDEARRLLSKPYRREVLARAVRCVLEGRPVEG